MIGSRINTPVNFIPFKKTPFDKLPEKPRLPHPYFDARIEEVQVVSRNFGTLRIHCRTLGDGPPLLLVHGLMTSGYSFRYLMPILAEHYSVYVPDLPGAGRSEIPHDALFTAPEIGLWIGEFMAAVGITGCPVIGNSMGGYLCLWLAIQKPECLSKLINVHSPGLPEPRFWMLHVLAALPGAREAFAWFIRLNTLRWAHNSVHYYDETLKSIEEAREYGNPLKVAGGAEAFIKYLLEALHPRTMRTFKQLLIALRKSKKPFPVPLLLAYGEKDPRIPPQTGDRFAALIPSARLVRISRASHLAQVDAPQQLARLAADFFA